MAKKKKILLAAAFLLLFIVTISVADRVGKEFEFFDDAIFVADHSEQEERVRALSDELGIVLNPGLDKHDELLAQRDRLVVCPDTLQFTPMEDGWFQGSVDRSRYVFSEQSLPENPLYVYTGGFVADGYKVRMALIGMDTALVSQVEVPVFEVVIEVRPENKMFPLNTGEIKVGMAGFSQFHWRVSDEDRIYQASYLYSSDTGAWFEKQADYGMNSCGSIPSLMLGTTSGGHFGRVDLFQIWGTANLALLSSHTTRVQFDLYRDDRLWANLSFWYPDGLYQQQSGEGLE